MVNEVHIAGTLMEHDGKILILHRKENTSQAGTWGLPAGRLEAGESKKQGAVREIFEETGLKVSEWDLEFIRDFEWPLNKTLIRFHTFRLRLSHPFKVKINLSEHSEYIWVTPMKCYRIDNLIHGFHDLLEKVYHIPK